MGCIHLNYDTTFAQWYVDKLILLNAVPPITKMKTIEDLLLFLLGTVDNTKHQMGLAKITQCYFTSPSNVKCTCFIFKNEVQYSGTVKDEQLRCVNKTKCVNNNMQFKLCERCNKSLRKNILERFASISKHIHVNSLHEYRKSHSTLHRLKCCEYHRTTVPVLCWVDEWNLNINASRYIEQIRQELTERMNCGGCDLVDKIRDTAKLRNLSSHALIHAKIHRKQSCKLIADLNSRLNEKNLTDSKRLKYIADIQNAQNDEPCIAQMTTDDKALNQYLEQLNLLQSARHIISHFMRISSND